MAIWKRILGAVVEGIVREAAGGVGRVIVSHFKRHGPVLEKALRSSYEQAWTAMRAALTGPSLLNRLRGGDREDVRAALEAFVHEHPLADDDAFRRRCLCQLDQASKAGALALPQSLPAGRFADQVAEEAGHLRRLAGDREDAARSAIVQSRLAEPVDAYPTWPRWCGRRRRRASRWSSRRAWRSFV